jgi:DNA-directed RNA polymerase II subunit RPB1
MEKNGILTSSQVMGIQFSMLSPDEIRRCSVAEITSKETYVNNKPIINGLFDPRMGTLEPGTVCPTDGLDFMHCPGYFGHIELARPVFYIQHLGTVIKILQCVCIKCSKLLIDKSKLGYIESMNNENRFKEVYKLAKEMERCGESNEDGCGCKQPTKYRHDSFAKITAEWSSKKDDAEDTVKMNITPEVAVRILRRITDEDVTFMGFSPIWSRPDWMICQVFAVPPPSVRPSVKHDAQQRSEDDLTHYLVQILKTNTKLKELIAKDDDVKIIEAHAYLLQYHMATMIDNKIPGASPMAQRSGRALKSIKDRLNGKFGRVRANLMGKRVDFSARSVITPDPNLSIQQLGVPVKIAKNITKPMQVNRRNYDYLTQLVRNGPDIYPGAKRLERKDGRVIQLKYVDRRTLTLEIGDIVHRHMMDGDAVLFNRQPTLHRMSMMGHIAKVMFKGNTFRMNVGDTKPYNADFDGDEMNLHMPQDIEAEIELRQLAAVPHQIISPAGNKPIIGIYQDSLLGSYQFTRANITFTPLEAMNLLCNIKRVDTSIFIQERVSSFDLLTQILPPMSCKVKNTSFSDKDNEKESNNVIEIVCGKMKRGQINDGILSSATNGIIHRLYKDYGDMISADFIDNIQQIVNEYMKTSSFSVGISDLMAGSAVREKILDIIHSKKQDVKNLIDETHLGVFDNPSGKSNVDEFESRVNNIMSEANSEAEKIGKSNLGPDNRFVIMTVAGSKGKAINITQMVCCVGQQSVDGKRIPYGFEHRTLPHFSKYDDSALARGFCESSFIEGLSPVELFFHAMGGRVGLIDTAVKTSTTGYIQRRLIKGMEDLISAYDGTVRNNKHKIIQFRYGDDNMDTVKIENQNLPLAKMKLDDIYSHYNTLLDDMMKLCFTPEALKRFKAQKEDMSKRAKQYIDRMILARDSVVSDVFENRDETKIHLPIAFTNVIYNVQHQFDLSLETKVDITPLETYDLLESYYDRLVKLGYYAPSELFRIAYEFFLSPKELLIVKHFHRSALVVLLETILLQYKQSIVNPGEMVGIIAAQSIGEPTTQLTLNTFHFAGIANKANVTLGVPRIEEILSLSENTKRPSMTIFLHEQEQTDQNRALKMLSMIEYTNLMDVTKSIELSFDPKDNDSRIREDQGFIQQHRWFEEMIDECSHQVQDVTDQSKWLIRIVLDQESMLEKDLTMDDLNFSLKHQYSDKITCIYSDYNADELVFRIRLNGLTGKGKLQKKGLDQTDEIYILKNFQEQLLSTTILRGIKHVQKANIRVIKNYITKQDGNYKKADIWVIDTIGTNLMEVLALDYIDARRTTSNDIREILDIFGIEAARNSIYSELSSAIEGDGGYINYHHKSLLCDRMTITPSMVPIDRHGINKDDIGPIAKASFEETPEMFLKASRHAELDHLRGVSSNIMCGQEGYYGTSSFQIMLDLDQVHDVSTPFEKEEVEIEVEKGPCSSISIRNDVMHLQVHSLKEEQDYELDL